MLQASAGPRCSLQIARSCLRLACFASSSVGQNPKGSCKKQRELYARSLSVPPSLPIQGQEEKGILSAPCFPCSVLLSIHSRVRRHPVGYSSCWCSLLDRHMGSQQQLLPASLQHCPQGKRRGRQKKKGKMGAVTWLRSCCSLLGCHCGMGNVASIPLGWSYLGARVTAQGFTPRLILSLVTRSSVSGRENKVSIK